MYFPYLRGKQFDLIVVRENAECMASAGFVPIVEPVKEAMGGLGRAIDAVSAADGEMILILNPQNGDYTGKIIQPDIAGKKGISPGVMLTEETSLGDVEEIYQSNDSSLITFVHAGFSDGNTLSTFINKRNINARHIFIDGFGGKLYRKYFTGAPRVLLRDGFKKRANRLHPEIEFFSDLHATFEDEGMNGFGDFLIVGNEYSETGGPAYAVAIHLTFIDEDKDNGMYIHHFKSDRFETPADPAGKFSEAVKKLVAQIERPGSKIYRTNAVNEFIELNEKGHFPGLGYVKKLSMQHHIETMEKYFKD